MTLTIDLAPEIEQRLSIEAARQGQQPSEFVMGKTRPCIIRSGASAGRLNLRIVAPITDWKDHYASYFWMSRLDPDENNGLIKTSAADAFQIRSVSLTRFVSYIGITTDERIERIVKTVGLCMR